MKQLMRCWFLSTVFLVCLFGGRAAIALDLLNVSAYSEGAPVPYGKNVVVIQSEVTGKKWLVHQPGAKDGSLKFSGLNVSGDIEMVVEVSYKTSLELKLISGANYIKLSHYQLSGGSTYWKMSDVNDSTIVRTTAKTVKLSISGYTAKLYDEEEDEFLTKITLVEPFLTYSDLEVERINDDNDELHQLTITAGGITPPATEFDKGVQAGIQQCVATPASCGIVSGGSGSAIKLINISTRASVLGGANDVISGFIISGTGSQKVILRGWGLAVGVDVALNVQKYPSGDFVANNNNWQSQTAPGIAIPAQWTMPQVTDSALLLTLPAGAYTATLSAGITKGMGLIGVDAID
ncbi:hypothetical protein [Candidatus Parabeggiatoa sp. HSG14]|uniref:hypothetical protein n=1 Tax=Candidatus Parabeggiatoa sp. HSG14 TaxID=3055593 RepID=UPI0025A78676|nr:hypothetical protein [Thiotrichales bacterium HSG14]